MLTVLVPDGMIAADKLTDEPYRLRLTTDDDDPAGTYRLVTEALMAGQRFGWLEEDPVITKARRLVEAIAVAEGVPDVVVGLASELGEAVETDQPLAWQWTTSASDRITDQTKIWISKA
jgi:hypothetical protein